MQFSFLANNCSICVKYRKLRETPEYQTLWPCSNLSHFFPLYLLYFWILFKHLMFVIFNCISVSNFIILFQFSGAWNDEASIRNAVSLALTCFFWFSPLNYLETGILLRTIENSPWGKVVEPQTFSPRQVAAFKCLLCLSNRQMFVVL